PRPQPPAQALPAGCRRPAVAALAAAAAVRWRTGARRRRPHRLGDAAPLAARARCAPALARPRPRELTLSRMPLTLATMPKKSPNETSPVAHFEQSLEELEQLVEKMEAGDLSLEQSLSAYERGVGLYRQCQQALEQAELRVRLLTDPAQPEKSEPFDTTGNDD